MLSPSQPERPSATPPVSGGVVAARRLRWPARARRRISQFDERVDHSFARFRGHPRLDRVMYAASELGDFSLVWHLLATGRALRSDRHLREGVRQSVMLGFESLLVNGLVKSFFNRARPEWDQHRPHRLRRPSSSSFPSGHASAAFTAAALLGHRRRTWPAYYVMAAVVATSRVYVRIHHASDVVGGAVIGGVFGRVARRAWPLPGEGQGKGKGKGSTR
ncbi:hypothetical protein BH18ACT4_BH18ACT4_00170 [soil metagenome]